MPLTPKQQAQFDVVCALIAGGKSLRAACKGKRAIGGTSTFYGWLDEKDKGGKLSAQYARARDEQAEHFADELIEIADNAKLSSDDRRIRLDARKWIASKLKPRKYGDKLALGGADDLPAIKQDVQTAADAFTTGIVGIASRLGSEKATKH